jgi:DNA polymerase IV
MPGVGQATVLHADLDAFYAAVEQLLDPRLRGKPIAVGGGVVLAASYEAKAFGVQGGMSARRARELCPQLRFVGGHFGEYQHLADQVIGVFHDVTPAVERVSIDEAFLDVAGSVRLFGSPATIASSIRTRVRSEIGLPISIGVASTKHLAKVASQVAKPDGLVVVEPEHEAAFLDPLPVELLWGVGPVTRERLADRGIRTIGQLAAASPSMLQGLLGGAVGSKLSSLAANVDPRRIEARRGVGSVGAQSALGRRPPTPELVRASIGYLSDRVAGRLRAAGRSGRTVTVRVRFVDLHSVTRSCTISAPTDSTLTLTEIGVHLVGSALADHPDEQAISLVAISVSNLVHEPVLQLELSLGLHDDALRPGSPLGSSRWAVDRAVDQVRSRFGRDAVDFAAVRFSDLRNVPDAFRELAEREVGTERSNQRRPAMRRSTA